MLDLVQAVSLKRLFTEQGSITEALSPGYFAGMLVWLTPPESLFIPKKLSKEASVQLSERKPDFIESP